MSSIKVAIVGVGNCASSLVQGVEYYKNIDESDSKVPGLMHNVFGGYMISDIEFVAAFDINREKVGKDLSEAIFAPPNCTKKFSDVPHLDVSVEKGPVFDGIGKYLGNLIPVDDGSLPVDVADILRDTGAEMMINYLPVGSKEATKYYAEECLKAGCGFINAIPEFIASKPKWIKRFDDAGLPCAGDDIKSQLGATIVHRVLADLFVNRGVEIMNSYQLNIGGNTDFQNMLERTRIESKRESKTDAVQSLVPYDVPLHIEPSGHVKFLSDNKICYLKITGKKFGDVPLELDLKLSVEDSPNSAGVMIDVIRAMKLALDRNIKGALTSISSFSFKHPLEQYPDSLSKIMVEDFIKGERNR